MTVSGSGHAEPRANLEAYAVRLGTGVPVTAGPQVRIRLAPPESLRTIGPPARARREFASTPVLLFNLLAFFATSFWGWIGDRLGRRWAMIIPSAIAVFTPRQAARRARRLPPGRRTTGLCRAHNRELKELAPDVVIPMHCTGRNFIATMRTEMPERLIDWNTGSRFTFGV